MTFLGGLLVLLVILAVVVVTAMIAFRWLFCRALVVAGDAKLLTQCTKCNYSLEGLGASPTCPECNTHHPTIYTTQTRTAWKIRTDLFSHWVIAALLCLGLWLIIALVIPPMLTALAYWSKGWSASERVEQLLTSTSYPWMSTELTTAIVLAWLAACAISLRASIRKLCMAFIVCGVLTILVATIAAFGEKRWNDDWYTYFWQFSPNPSAATIAILSVVTLFACMINDAVAHSQRTQQTELNAQPKPPEKI